MMSSKERRRCFFLGMKIDKKDVKRILFITLTNIGDIILSTPIITALKREFSKARIDVMVGPLGRDIFIRDPRIFKVITYNKHLPLQEKQRLVRKLKSMKYDLVIDLKNSLFPILVGSRYRTSPIHSAPKNIMHKKEFHLWKLKYLGIDVGDESFSVHIGKKDRDYVDALLENVPNQDKIVTVSPTAKSLIKRWKKNGFAQLGDRLIDKLNMSIVMIGDNIDKEIIEDIISDMKFKPSNFAGLTTIPQLAYLLERSRLLITNDSAPMHIGCTSGTKVLAIFGPTDPRKYGPRGRDDRVLKRELHCSPCETAQCRFKHECMKSISVDEVYSAAEEMLR